MQSRPKAVAVAQLEKGLFTHTITLWQLSSSDEIRTRENIS